MKLNAGFNKATAEAYLATTDRAVFLSNLLGLHSINQLTDELETEAEAQLLRTLADDNWIPACGGTEKPFRSRSGKTLLYCWQPSTGRHAYLDCGSDIILSDDEAAAALAL